MNKINPKSTTSSKQIPTYIFALGGLEEIGKNCYGIEYNDEIIIIDAGMKIDNRDNVNNIIFPDFQYLNSPHLKKKTLIFTHGHEDHIGAIIALIKQCDFNAIYAPGLAISLMKYKLKQSSALNNNLAIPFIEIKNKTVVKTAYSSCRFFAQNHSIPDAYGLSIKTPNGIIVSTGDFKFDFSPLDHHCDIHYMAELGQNRNVSLLMSDSTNSMVPGATSSESEILFDIENLFLKAKHRMILSTFASNVYRINKILELSVKYNRKVCLLGRSMIRIVQCALQSKYLKFPPSMFINPAQINNTEFSKLLILCTGSQGEPLSALSRMADQSHPYIKIVPNDMIIFSSNPIPGNYLNVEVIINQLTKLGATVLNNSKNNLLHTSGHASIDEQKLMATLIRPKYFMPMHGHYQMLKAHKNSVVKTGIKPENVFILSNGEKLKLLNGVCTKDDDVIPVDSVYVDHDSETNLHAAILKEREVLSTSGIMVIILNLKKGQLIKKPIVITKGLVFMKENRIFLGKCSRMANDIVRNIQKNNKVTNEKLIKSNIKNKLRNYIYKSTHANPIISTIIMEENN